MKLLIERRTSSSRGPVEGTGSRQKIFAWLGTRKSQRGLERKKSCTGVAPRNVDLAGVRAESAVNRDVICLGGICLLIIATIHD
jgi:hypothetical protein